MRKKIIFAILLLNSYCEVFCQQENKKYLASLSIVLNDSSVILHPQLKVIDKKTVLILPKSISYGNESEPVTCKFFIQRIVRNSAVNVYSSDLRQPMFDPDCFVERKYTWKDSLSDMIELNNYLPFEKGEYIICIQFKIFEVKKGKKQEIIVDSDWVPFEIKVIPKGGIYGLRRW
jgi:hypothetical protein